MRIHKTTRGFVILRGVRNRQFFGFFVDGAKTSWTKSQYGARVYASRDSAVLEMYEIVRLRRKAGEVKHAG